MAISNAREGSVPDDFSSAITVDSVEAAKLDARVFSADDFDGQAEGAASSGNFNYAMMQGDILGDVPPDSAVRWEDSAGQAQAYEMPLDDSAQPALTQIVFTDSAPPAQPTETAVASEDQTQAVAGPTFTSTSVYSANAGDTHAENTHTSETTNTSTHEFVQEIIREGGGSDGDGDITIIINETNNITNTTYNTINIDNSVTGDTITDIGGDVTNIIDLGGGGLGSVTNVVETVVNVIGDVVGDTVTSVTGDVTNILTEVVGGLGDTVGDITETITNILDLGDLGDTVGDVVGDVTNILDLGDLGDTIGDVVGDVTNILDLGDLGDTVGGVTETVTNILDLGDLGDTIGGVTETVTNLLDLGDLGDTVGGITETVTNILDLGDLGGTVGGVTETVTNILDLGDLGGTVGGITETVTNILDLGDLGDTVGGVTETVTNLLGGDIDGTVGGVTETVTNLLDLGDIGDTITNVTETVTNLLGDGGPTGGLPDIVGDLLGGGGSPGGDTDLVIDAALGDGGSILSIPTIEIPLDPVESLLGDIDLHFDSAVDPSQVLDGSVVENLVSAVGDGDVGGLLENVSNLLGGGNGEGDVAIGIGQGGGQVSPLGISLDPVEALLGNIDIGLAGTNEVVTIDDSLVPGLDGAGDPIGAVTDIVTGALGGDAPAGGLTEFIGDLLGGGTGGGADSDLIVDTSVGLGDQAIDLPALGVPLDPVEGLLGDINLDAPADLTSVVDGSLLSDVANIGGGDVPTGDLLNVVTDILDGTGIGDGMAGGVLDVAEGLAESSGPAGGLIDAVNNLLGTDGVGDADGPPDLTVMGEGSVTGDMLATPSLDASLDIVDSLTNDLNLDIGAAADLLDLSDTSNDGPLGSDLGLAVNEVDIPLMDPDQALASLGDLFSQDSGIGGGIVETVGSILDDLPQPGGDLSGGLQLVLDQAPINLPIGLGLF